jgi:hypothetical protein
MDKMEQFVVQERASNFSISEGQIPRHLLRVLQSKRVRVWTSVDTSEQASEETFISDTVEGGL